MQSSGNIRRIVMDTYAWIEYFEGSQEGIKVREYVENSKHTFELFTPSIVIAELSDKFRRKEIAEWGVRKRFIKLKSKILALEESTADKAGEVKQELKREHKDAGLADAIILAHSIQINAYILTGDKHLAKTGRTIMLN